LKSSTTLSGSSGGIFDLDARQERLKSLDFEMVQQGFWDKQEQAKATIDEANRIKGWLEPWQSLDARVADLRALVELLEEEDDAELAIEFGNGIADLADGVEALELRTMLQGADDHLEAIVTINPGAGGLESQDWAEMLMRMYTRWAERRGFTVNVLDLQPAEEGGIKNATFEINGESAYGFLKAEAGVHRLVRISPFDAQSRRHTSFASVFVYPQIDDAIVIEIDDGDVRVDTYRASGAGGQHVNKTDSAVRLTHRPTGIVVACQQERSQHKNRATAMKMLRAALYKHELELKEKERAVLEASKGTIGFGNQIRSYVFQPYTMVNDHRTEFKLTDVQSVMDGDLDPLIQAYLKKMGATSSS
jgi:peptide chain release factor 2